MKKLKIKSMAKFTWTIKELEEVKKENKEEVRKFIMACIHDRKETLTNVYSPMYKKCDEVISWLDDLIK
jgi:hypothetical protein